MDDSLRVCSPKSVGNLDAKIKHRFDVQRLASDLVPQRLPLQQFHGDEGLPIGLINLVDRADVRVIQCRSGTSFTTEPFKGLCIVREFLGKEFQRNVATEL